MLAVASEVLEGSVIKLASATAEEIPALVKQAKSSVEQIVKSCTDSASLDHLEPEIAETMLADLISLGETMQAQIAGIVKLRWAQLAGAGPDWTPRTKH